MIYVLLWQMFYECTPCFKHLEINSKKILLSIQAVHHPSPSLIPLIFDYVIMNNILVFVNPLVAAKCYVTDILVSNNNTTQKIIKRNSLAINESLLILFVTYSLVGTKSIMYLNQCWFIIIRFHSNILNIHLKIKQGSGFAIFCVPVQYLEVNKVPHWFPHPHGNSYPKHLIPFNIKQSPSMTFACKTAHSCANTSLWMNQNH